MSSNKDGIMLILSSPSGAGKTTLVKLLSKNKDFHISISHTTRKPRVNEIQHKDYHFINNDEFKDLIKKNEFLEYAEYVGDYYGTPTHRVSSALKSQKNVLLELELHGARQVKRAMPNAVMIFVAPPNLSELERRLRGRGTDTEEKIAKRLERAREEINSAREFDYLVVNDSLLEAVKEFSAIIRAECQKAERMI